MVSQLTAYGSTPSLPKLDPLRQQAQELEGMFINTLMKQMFSSLNTDQKSGGGGDAEATWRGIQAEQMSEAIAKSGGVGIADAIYTDLLAVQQASQSSQSTTGVPRS